MSKIGNHRVGIQETSDYRFGWESAERGEPLPAWAPILPGAARRIEAQRLGWNDFHVEEQSI